MTFQTGQTVKLSKPVNEAEAALTFTVAEDNGDRVHASVDGAKGFGHTVCYATDQFTAQEA